MRGFGCEAALKFADLNGLPFGVVNSNPDMTIVASNEYQF
jgi:hypothetical protein